jgi:hypothetical protein
MGSYLCTPETQKRYKKREHSSVGLEHLPYKQRVTGSTPVAPTGNQALRKVKLLGAFLFDT